MPVLSVVERCCCYKIELIPKKINIELEITTSNNPLQICKLYLFQNNVIKMFMTAFKAVLAALNANKH